MLRRSLLFTLIGTVVSAGAVAAWYGLGGPSEGGLPGLPTHPDSAQEVLYARPFVLDAPYTHHYRLEAPSVSSGWILVLRVDPELTVPRQSYEPVLYVGDETAQRWNTAQPGGNMVVTVPAALDASGVPNSEWMSQPIWFGSPELPERVDATRIHQELVAAIEQGIGPMPGPTVQRACAEGGDALYLKNIDALQPRLADLIERFSPAETDLVRGMRVPVTH
ncbi:MAG: hypothetical protein ACI841_004975 [Planctomycetota bacterium]|jgi:hypothetical protein